MKTLTEILQTRRSTRKFDGRKPARQVVQGLLDLAFMAPSSKNSRSTRFVVVSDAETLARMAEMRDFGSALLADAPCAVLICGDTTATDLWLDNAAISATVLQLAAVESGLASCWVHVNGRPRHQQPAPSLAKTPQPAAKTAAETAPSPTEPPQGAVAPPQSQSQDAAETAPSPTEPPQGAVAQPQPQPQPQPQSQSQSLDAAAAAETGETAEDFLRTFLPLPAEWRPLCAIALGYSAEPERPRTPRDNGDKIIWLGA